MSHHQENQNIVASTLFLNKSLLLVRLPCISIFSLTYIYIYIYIYIFIHLYCHPQTDCFVVSELFSVVRHVGLLKLGLKPAQLYVTLSIVPLSQQANLVSLGIIRHYVVAFICLHFCLTGYQSAQFIQRALHYASGSCKFFRQSDEGHSIN